MKDCSPSMVYHLNSRLANEKQKWSGSDSEINFVKHMQDPATADRLRSLGWSQDNIDYEYNQQGFRSGQFDQQPVGVALGCSFTFGVGVNVDQTWPAVLSKRLDLEILNLGVGGSSADTAYRILQGYIGQLNCKFVTFCMPPIERFEIWDYDSDCFVSVMPYETSWPYHSTQYIKLRLTNSIEHTLNQQKNIQAMQQMCDARSIPFYYLSINDFDYDRAGRDLMHPGIDSQKNFADKMFHKMKGSHCDFARSC